MIVRVLMILFISLSVSVSVPYAGATTVDDYPSGIAASGIMSSRHNMGNYGRLITVDPNITTEACIFCHTPHFANRGAGVNPIRPLWNRGSQALTAFTAYGTTSSGTTVNSTDIGSTSLACLSCHDGITTWDTIVNTPGKDGIVAGGQDRNWAFRMPIFGFGSVQSDHFDTSETGTCFLCHTLFMYGPGPENPADRLSVGTDLTNDHPVSILYNEGLTDNGLRPPNTVIASIDLVSELSGSGDPALLNNMSQNRWAVNGFISDTATIADLLRDGKVECTSCHDPHFRNLSWDEVEADWNTGLFNLEWCNSGGPSGEECTDGNFLRRVGGNSGSAVCRTCHDK